MSNKNKNSSLVLIHISLSMDGQSACFVYKSIHITIVWVGEGGCKTETPHSLCINAAQLAQYCPLLHHRQTQISPSTSISYNFGDRHMFFLGNAMFRESERSANIMATSEHSIHPNLNIPKNVALGS